MEIQSPYTPRPFQLLLHNKLKRFNWIVLHRRAGKCLDIDTPIPLFNGGFKKMGDIDIGDVLISEQGTPTTVTNVSDIKYDHTCYRMTFSDGSTVVADSEHLWYTETKLDRCGRSYTKKSQEIAGSKYGVCQRRKGTNKTTAEIAATLRYAGENNHSIPLALPVQYPTKQQPIPPYLFGLWLGDGTSRQSAITTMDPEVVDAIYEYANAQNYSVTVLDVPDNKANTYRVHNNHKPNGMQSILRKLGVLENKHIPDCYKYSSIDDRRELLAGICDSDGCINKSGGQVDITLKSQKLFDGVCELIRSLGMLVYIKDRYVNGVRYNRLSFRPNYNCFRIARKTERYKPVELSKASQQRFIVGCDVVDSVPVKCISVDNPSKLFLCGEEFITTHNSIWSVNQLIIEALNNPNENYAYVAPQRSQAKDIAWAELKKYTSHLIDTPAEPKFNEAELLCTFHNGATIRFYGVENPDNIRGKGLSGVVFDEAAMIPEEVWTKIFRPMLSDKKGWAIFITTPMGKNWFYWKFKEAANGERKDSYAIKLTPYQTKALDEEELADLKADLTEEEFDQEFMCSFESAISGAFYIKELKKLREDNKITECPYNPSYPVHTAWDLGMNDSTAIWFFQKIGTSIHVIEYLEDNGLSIIEWAKLLHQKPYDYGTAIFPHDIAVRELGSGITRLEVMEQHGFRDPVVLPRLPEIEGINAARMLLPRCKFNEQTTSHGLECLSQCRSVKDIQTGTWSKKSVHDSFSHGAAAFRYLAVGQSEIRDSSSQVFDWRSQSTTAKQWDCYDFL